MEDDPLKHLAGHWTLGHYPLLDIVHEIETASPRVTIVVGVALIDDCLSDALAAYAAIQDKAFLARCFGERGSIRDLSQKIDLGAAFGMYGLVTHSDLHKLRDMRNEAAHKTNKRDFGSAVVRGICRDLKIPNAGLRPNSAVPTDARSRFIYTVSVVTDYLLAAATVVRKLDRRPVYPKFRLP
jgi:hypothetical protein